MGETSCSYLHTAFSFASFTDFPSLVKWQVGKQTPSGRIERTLVFVGLWWSWLILRPPKRNKLLFTRKRLYNATWQAAAFTSFKCSVYNNVHFVPCPSCHRVSIWVSLTQPDSGVKILADPPFVYVVDKDWVSMLHCLYLLLKPLLIFSCISHDACHLYPKHLHKNQHPESCTLSSWISTMREGALKIHALASTKDLAMLHT